jgi:hypothetical protein
MVVSLVFLIGCGSFKTTTPSSCPVSPKYTQKEWSQIYNEISKLPENSKLIAVLHDYLDVLAKLRICNAKK